MNECFVAKLEALPVKTHINIASINGFGVLVDSIFRVRCKKGKYTENSPCRVLSVYNRSDQTGQKSPDCHIKIKFAQLSNTTTDSVDLSVEFIIGDFCHK